MSNRGLYLLFASILIAFMLVVGFLSIKEEEDKVNPVALQALNYLYSFETPEELDSNMEGLKVLVSEEVYNQLTIDKTERVLNVYLKFQGNPSSVEIVRADNQSIFYRLNTSSIDSSRLFLFKYEVYKGKLTNVFEAEVVPFPTSIGE